MSGLIESVLGMFRDPKVEKQMATLLAAELRGMPLTEAVGLLGGLQKAARPLGVFIEHVTGHLLSMPLSEVQKIIAATPPTASSSGQIAKTATKLRTAERELAKATAKVAVAAKPRKKLTMSPARKAQLKLQGRYIGLMRSLSAMQTKVAKAVAAKHGMKAAIKHIQGLAKKA